MLAHVHFPTDKLARLPSAEPLPEEQLRSRVKPAHFTDESRKGICSAWRPWGKNQSRAPPQSRPQTAGAGMPRARLGACPAAPGGRAPFCARAPLPERLTRPVLPPGVHPPPQPAFLGGGIVLRGRRLWLELWLERQARGCRVAAARGAPAAEARRVEPVVQQPVHGCSADAGGSPRGVRGRALRLPAVVAHARGWWGGARAPAQTASLEVILGRLYFPGSSLRLPIQQPQSRRWRMASRALLPSSLRRSHLLHALPLECRSPGARLEHARSRRGIGDPRAPPAGAPRARLPPLPQSRDFKRGFLASQTCPRY